MTSRRFEIRDAQALFVTKMSLERLSGRLEACGLSAAEPEIEVLNSDPGAYTSEVRLFLSTSQGIADAIEFFVWNESVEQASLEETQHYVEVALADACARVRSSGKV